MPVPNDQPEPLPHHMLRSCCHLPAVGPGGLRWGFFFFGWDGWLIGLRFSSVQFEFIFHVCAP